MRNLLACFVLLAATLGAQAPVFAPTQGEFKGARTFAQQAAHLASVLYMCSAGALAEKNPVEMGTDENGAATLKTKEDVVKYSKDAFAYSHKATLNLTDKNLTEMVPSPLGSGNISRASAASIAVWRSFDHYGQRAIYARMNGIVPPASRAK